MSSEEKSSHDHAASIAATWSSNANASSREFARNHYHLLFTGESGLEGALAEAASSPQSRLLLINIQNYNDNSSAAAMKSFLMNKLWADHGIQDLIKASCVFFQTTSDTRDAIFYSHHYNPTQQLPYVALLNPEKRRVLWCFAGRRGVDLDPTTFSKALSAALEEYGASQINSEFSMALDDTDDDNNKNKNRSSADNVAIELGIQSAVMKRMSSADFLDEEEFQELLTALQASQKATDGAGVDRTMLKRHASQELGLEMGLLERMTSADATNEQEYRDLQAALFESKKKQKKSENDS